ncbi:Acyl carrier protein, mitochondrial [Smittium culicis]|uniref:Acyl carrier protein n=1 Tax=Smittium culicis TaxID=133412 RepID=A0A1R1XSJ3_9FUNG|nr:Acyl carrier protein, mitochondrial [Smittium culicis]
MFRSIKRVSALNSKLALSKVSAPSFIKPAMFAIPSMRSYSAAGGLTHDEIKERIFSVLNDFDKVKHENISETADFSKDLGLDSLDTVEVVMAIEEEFNVEIPDEEADSISTVAHAIKFISNSEGAN